MDSLLAMLCWRVSLNKKTRADRHRPSIGLLERQVAEQATEVTSNHRSAQAEQAAVVSYHPALSFLETHAVLDDQAGGGRCFFLAGGGSVRGSPVRLLGIK